MARTPKSAMLHARVTPEEKHKFEQKASKHGTPSEVLRELATAYTEGRLRIYPPVISKESSLYVIGE